ncbi:MAG: methyltransferase domain-containing protein [Myxococcales bacterium]|nr:methyltransferase domain-containing protein [Myxococcales bacterium]
MELQPRASTLDVEATVRERYSGAAHSREQALCCPVTYDSRYLDAIPKEVLERDYGCGDPSRYIHPGETVLDLGSGGGKICFIAAQIVGPKGCVIGIDMNQEMLELAQRSAPRVAERIGYSNVSFHRARIQDLKLDLDSLDRWLSENPVHSASDLSALEDFAERRRSTAPLVADGSVDIVVSNCVLNLVRPEHKPQLIREIYRVLKRGGRIAISDIVSDRPVPEDLRADPELWSGCISGAFQEQELLGALEDVGFYGVTVDRWEPVPFSVVQGIEFRAVTVTARKAHEGLRSEADQTVIYRGPWKRVEDDAGQVLRRGERVRVSPNAFQTLTSDPYAHDIIPIEPAAAVTAAENKGCCS